MNKILRISLAACLTITASYAFDVHHDGDKHQSVRKAIDSFGKIEAKEISTVDKFKNIFIDGKVTGQIRSVYASYNRKVGNNEYATAIGGQLKYELASLNGFNAGFAFTTSQDIGFATGDVVEHNSELSSTEGDYTELSEAYINYKYDEFNFRAGRQMIDTPLADSDDIRMAPNTFEAYMATYDISKFTITAGNLQRFQGVDAGWIDTGDNGTWFGGITYSDALEFNAWYYDISNDVDSVKAAYFDFGADYEFSKIFILHINVQYLNEQDIDNSSIEADIYGALVELEVYNFGFNIAYNYSEEKTDKESFSGFGGGTLYTSMDTMIIDEITRDRDAQAIVAGLIYQIDNFIFLYAYGDFRGDANSLGKEAHIVEQDIGFEYNVDDEFVVAAIYVVEEDKEDSNNDWNRAQVMLKYDF